MVSSTQFWGAYVYTFIVLYFNSAKLLHLLLKNCILHLFWETHIHNILYFGFWCCWKWSSSARIFCYTMELWYIDAFLTISWAGVPYGNFTHSKRYNDGGNFLIKTTNENSDQILFVWLHFDYQRFHDQNRHITISIVCCVFYYVGPVFHSWAIFSRIDSSQLRKVSYRVSQFYPTVL